MSIHDPGTLPPDDDGDPFWERLRSRLGVPTPAPAPRDPARFAAGLIQRRHWELEAGRWRWRVQVFAGAAVAAAAIIGVVVGWEFHPEQAPATSPQVATSAEPAAWFEDGGPAMAPAQEVGWASYMPRRTGDLTQVSSATDRPHPWLGIWTRPVQQFTADGGRHSAHLVVRVAGGSPAWEAGLRPGDILTSLDGCSLSTPDCIGAHLSGLTPGSVVNAVWWDAYDGRARQAVIRLGALHE